MRWIHNKSDPGSDVGRLLNGRPRDGTGNLPRDGTYKTARGAIILVRGSPEDRYYFMPRTGPPKDPRVRNKSSSKWRTTLRIEPALRTGKGRGMSLWERKVKSEK